MSKSIIKVENLSKSYFIGHQNKERYTALRDVLTNSAKGFIKNAGKMIKGEQLMGNDDIEEFFALKDINFEINQGDRVGIIGRNGAGKSTLLKILSRITEPTSGRVTINGRVASLLEVGTGFHPELTGRENIYLNGAILGMSRNDIKRKFDEIVAFAEVEKFLDTPVKRYSSGMYVRLAFAVAAHLEPEILIVDEVLAVGDAQFQKKCLGKMEDVSKEGRTVIFVSHNMSTLKSLCQSIIYLKNGSIIKQGPVDICIKNYISENQKIVQGGNIPRNLYRKYSTGDAFIDSIKALNSAGLQINNFSFGEKFRIQMTFTVEKKLQPSTIQFIISSTAGENILSINQCIKGVYQFKTYDVGMHKIEVNIDAKFLPLDFDISAVISQENGTPIDWVENVLPFSISDIGVIKGADYPWNVVYGYFEINPDWDYCKI